MKNKRRFEKQKPKEVLVNNLFSATIVPKNRAAKRVVKFMGFVPFNASSTSGTVTDFKVDQL